MKIHQTRSRKEALFFWAGLFFCLLVFAGKGCSCGKLPQGALCGVDSDCQSGFCIVGYCAAGKEQDFRNLPEGGTQESKPKREEETVSFDFREETPNELFVCKNGETRSCYTGNKVTLNVGICLEGKQECVDHRWKKCEGEITPTKEVCDGKDNNCNGIIDENAIPNKILKDGEVGICKGSFLMGSPHKFFQEEEKPQHKVILTRSFAIWRYEVTQKEFLSLMGYNPSKYKECGLSCPAEHLSWNEAVYFCNMLSQKNGLELCFKCQGNPQIYFSSYCKVNPKYSSNKYYNCPGYRLPTEAEWEYAARAGTTTDFYNGSFIKEKDFDLDKIAWYYYNSDASYPGCFPTDLSGKKRCIGPHSVGKKVPNPWGLFDVIGNVKEWVWDSVAYQGKYSPATVVDPIYGENPLTRGVRGCSWGELASTCRVTRRTFGDPRFRESSRGVRPVRTIF